MTATKRVTSPPKRSGCSPCHRGRNHRGSFKSKRMVRMVSPGDFEKNHAPNHAAGKRPLERVSEVVSTTTHGLHGFVKIAHGPQNGPQEIGQRSQHAPGRNLTTLTWNKKAARNPSGPHGPQERSSSGAPTPRAQPPIPYRCPRVNDREASPLSLNRPAPGTEAMPAQALAP